MLSKMTPEPTPVSGMTPRLPAFDVPVTVIRTTAGLTLAATAIVADDSSIATGWSVPTFVACGTLERCRAPVGRARRPRRARGRCPAEARTADRSGAARTRPAARPRSTGVAGAVGAGVGAGSYQRSGVTGGRLVERARPIGARLGRRREAIGRRARGWGRGRARPGRRRGRRRPRADRGCVGRVGRGQRRALAGRARDGRMALGQVAGVGGVVSGRGSSCMGLAGSLRGSVGERPMGCVAGLSAQGAGSGLTCGRSDGEVSCTFAGDRAGIARLALGHACRERRRPRRPRRARPPACPPPAAGRAAASR